MSQPRAVVVSSDTSKTESAQYLRRGMWVLSESGSVFSMSFTSMNQIREPELARRMFCYDSSDLHSPDDLISHSTDTADIDAFYVLLKESIIEKPKFDFGHPSSLRVLTCNPMMLEFVLCCESTPYWINMFHQMNWSHFWWSSDGDCSLSGSESVSSNVWMEKWMEDIESRLSLKRRWTVHFSACSINRPTDPRFTNGRIPLSGR
jgi:hypothetical protein